MKSIIALIAAACISTPFQQEEAQTQLAIAGVNVLPMDRDTVLLNQTVLIKDGVISALAPSSTFKIPPGVKTIDGRGKYLLPGLADMHVHLSTADEFPMFVGNGVLTVRDLNGSPETLEWKRAVAEGRMEGPRLYVSGPMIAGPSIPWRNKIVANSADEARAAVLAQKAAGYDQIKLYDGISSEVFASAIETAKQNGMISTGHIPESVGFDGVLASGMTGLEHLDKTLFATMGHNLDSLKIPSIVSRIAESKMWVTPTLESMVQLSKVSSGKYDSLMNRPEALASPPPVRAFWTSVTSRMKGDRSEQSSARCGSFCLIQFRLAGELSKAGVPILAGTDFPNAVLVPGFSLHDELAALEYAGLTRYKVLEAATSAPARFLREEDQWGKVAVGQKANLLLVNANPLRGLETLRKPAGVVLGGKWIPDGVLRKMRKGL